MNSLSELTFKYSFSIIIRMTSKVKTFFHIFTGSLIPRSIYYHKIPHVRYRFSGLYFFFLIVFLNAIFTGFVVIKMNPFRVQQVTQSLLTALENYPNNLTIKIQNGSMTTNSDKPYLLWLDYQDKKHLLVVVDQEASPSKISEYNSFLLLTGNEIVYWNRNYCSKQIGTVSYPFNEEITIQTVKRIQNAIIKLVTILLLSYPSLAILLFLLFTVSSFVVTLGYLLIASAGVYLLFGLLKKKNRLPFRKMFQISLHAVTPPFVFNYFFTISGFTTLF